MDLDAPMQPLMEPGDSGGVLKAAFRHVGYDVFRLVIAFAVRMSRLNALERGAINNLNLRTLSKSIHSSKVIMKVVPPQSRAGIGLTWLACS